MQAQAIQHEISFGQPTTHFEPRYQPVFEALLTLFAQDAALAVQYYTNYIGPDLTEHTGTRLCQQLEDAQQALIRAEADVAEYASFWQKGHFFVDFPTTKLVWGLKILIKTNLQLAYATANYAAPQPFQKTIVYRHFKLALQAFSVLKTFVPQYAEVHPKYFINYSVQYATA